MTSHDDRRTVRNIRRSLLEWYRRRRRDLPWRRTSDPWRIWVSEVMLQQTRVGTVIPYYTSFVERFPDIRALAEAREDDVLKAWEGLGYYARARNLHRAARVVVREHGGRVPDDPERFRALPGAGEYITAAVQSIAFGRPMAVVDGNVRRVIARLYALDAPADTAAGRRAVAERARALLAPRTPGDFNQAMMELGATVCLPRAPRCDACPLRRPCRARALGEPERWPARRSRRRPPLRRVAVGVVVRRGRVLITRRASRGLLGGLWEFPGGAIEAGESPREACEREIREETGLDVQVAEHVARVSHAYSHFRVELDVFLCRSARGRVRLDGPVAFRWVTPDELDDFAFPGANRKFIPALRRALAAARAGDATPHGA